MTIETVPALLARLLASDPGRPRVTAYDDTDGPTRGERIELSARVLGNWVAKAGNLLQDELDAGPGTRVLLALPPHWRTLYWALAAWSVGACVVLPDADADVVVTDDPVRATGRGTVLVTLAALSRSASGPVPPGALDEARDLSAHGDVLVPWDVPGPTHDALVDPDGTTTFGDLVPAAGPTERVHTATSDTETLLRLALGAWAGDGSLVLTRGTPDRRALAARLRAEGVTRDA
ncbi:TIGR03089 family protein [Phycicoccus sp. CSK15P-2]|uniref:TIGR03089 family protein n=1 Tax=Phycicoccus sp. CSK15P-2 TaxID=2807627 RepID=UPI0027DAC180|nr:TIGR03089 family protein [Phycicoccus sp. CSK15P-2]